MNWLWGVWPEPKVSGFGFRQLIEWRCHLPRWGVGLGEQIKRCLRFVKDSLTSKILGENRPLEMPLGLTFPRGMSKWGSREREEIKFLLSHPSPFRWLGCRPVNQASLILTMMPGQEASLQKISWLPLSQKFWIQIKVIYSTIRDRKLKMKIAWERIHSLWIFIKI